MSDYLPRDNYWLLPPLLTTLGFGLALILLAHLLRSQRSPSSTIAWLLVILLIPYVGVPLYLTFGGRKMRQRARRKEPVYRHRRPPPAHTLGGATERILRTHGVSPPTAGNRIRVVTSGVDAYRELLALIDRANETIYITTYILGPDAVGTAIVERLAERARAGVEVRLLMDDVGSWRVRVRRRFFASLLASGAKIAYFMPILHIPFRGRANLRNHRKIVVVDGRHALTGGMNLAEEYMGPTPSVTRWRDYSLVISGPAVADFTDLFHSDWKFATGEDLLRRDVSFEPAGADGSVAQVVASGPDVAGDPLYEALVSAAFASTRRLWVVTPYFVPDETLARALDLAARRGVDVRLVIPAHSNHLMADLARASYMRQVHESGGRVLLFRPVMLHAKVVLIDDQMAIVGSANMDMRSLFLNYEVATFLYSLPEIDATAEWIHGLMAESASGLPVRDRLRALAEDVVRLLSPLL